MISARPIFNGRALSYETQKGSITRKYIKIVVEIVKALVLIYVCFDFKFFSTGQDV